MRGSRFTGWAFVLPAIFFLAALIVYPTIQTIRLSFDTGGNFSLTEFVGLQNYIDLFTRDRLFLDLRKTPPEVPKGSLPNTVLWIVVFTLGTVGFGLLIAVLADSVKYGRLVKTIVFVPMAISFTATGVIWRFVYSPDPNIGVLNAAIQGIDSSFRPIAWLGRTDLANFALIAAAVWVWTGFCMVILSAALRGLDSEVLDAAKIDGANAWQTFWRIKVPIVWPTIVVVTMTMVVTVLKIFDLVLIMTNGGPRGATRILAFSMFTETFTNFKPGYGSAIAVVMLILVLPFVIINLRQFKAGK